MKRGAAAAVLLALLLAGCGDEEVDGIQVPAGLARQAPAVYAYAKPLGAAVEVEPASQSEDYLRAFVSTFNSLTPENAMKWEVVQPQRGEFDFARADELVELARRTGKRVRGHTLVWDQQLPDWIEETDWEPRVLADVLRRHVRAVVGHYRGRVAEWDVVNEPLEADGSWKKSVFYRALGPKYVDIAFRAAREADPRARLFLNEVAAEPDSPKATALLALAADLVRREVPLDGVGYQNHTIVDTFPDRRVLGARFGTLAALGLDGAITEMDVIIPAGTPGGEERQAEAYREAALACANAPNCTGVTLWGVTDEYSWLGAAKLPLPFDGKGRPKPALGALLEPLAR